jgi:hypothetical protein
MPLLTTHQNQHNDIEHLHPDQPNPYHARHRTDTHRCRANPRYCYRIAALIPSSILVSALAEVAPLAVQPVSLFVLALRFASQSGTV